MVVFLNYNDGDLIYLGINNQGKSIGVKDINENMLRIKDRIKHNIPPSAMGLFDVVSEPFDGISIIKIIVTSGQVHELVQR